MPSPVVSIIIPSRDRTDLLRQCLGALAADRHSVPTEIIVADTGTGEAAAIAAEADAKVLLLEGATFAQAVNCASLAAHGDYLLLLNDDILPLCKLVWRMYGVAELNGGSVIGARLLYPDGLIQHAGIGFDIDGNPYHLFHGGPGEHPEAMKRRWLPAVTFACALVPHRMWATLGGLCEDFKNGYEDIDFCLRACEQGYGVLYDHLTVATHYTAQTSGRFEHEAANKRLFVERWVGSGRLSYVTGVWPFSLLQGGA